MKWTFADYKNIKTLSKLDFSDYDKVIVFLGALQAKIDFGDRRCDFPISLEIIQIRKVHDHNLDFHLAYYLGNYDETVDKRVKFEVVSDDKGYFPLVDHRSPERKCQGM